ncbi:U-box domain-containing protein 33 [Linum perenne]
MELLNPLLPLHDPTPQSTFSILPPSSSPDFRVRFDPIMGTQLSDIVEEAATEDCTTDGLPKVYVAVGKSVEKSASLLQWSFNFFSGHRICLLHVHRPSPLIPTLLGKLPANQANPEVVLGYRNEERQKMMQALERYLAICRRAKVEASCVSKECDHVHRGILDLVDQEGIKKLVIGAVPEHWLKVKKSSSLMDYVAKNAPVCCQIWFINKGNLVWTREASEGSGHFQTDDRANGGVAEIGRSQRLITNEPSNHPQFVRSSSGRGITCARVNNWVQTDCTEEPVAVVSTSINGCLPHHQLLHFSPTSSCSGSGSNSTERRRSSDFDLESLYCQLEEVNTEAEVLRNTAAQESLKCRRLEHEALEAIGKVRTVESALAHEMELRREAEDELRNEQDKKEKLLQERKEVNRELQRTMRSVALLDSYAHEANLGRNEAAAELKQLQTSLASLRQEKQRIRRQKMEALHWLERWRSSNSRSGAAKCNGFLGYAEELPELAEFPLSDLQTATCNFSESFKLGGGAYGCVYKGEMLGRTVAIKKLHSHNMQGQSEFHKEVQVLGKLQHPHLVTLLGASSEAWCLIYEYLPNGSLQDRLLSKSNNSSLTWNIRTRIIAEIASALSFLHSSKPEKIVHGDLKPQHILLDSELICKICEFGICRLVSEDNVYSPSISRITEPKGTFPYVDPEFQRVGVLTPKSDVYSFGVIILQLLTGRPPIGLTSEVRRMMSSGKLSSILDPSAGEWPAFVTKRLADLALQFCELSSRNRPDLSPALVRELEQLHVSEERPVPSFFLCPILQEIMHDPQIAADGFTYEGEALREWLGNGHETSPMTNLKLSHLHLTPNHALRLAIQEWLCRS